MATIIPITLVGDNLGQRHLFLNSLVNEAFERNEEFVFIKNLPEKSAVDHLFKIDYASKIRNVDYIIENFKNDDLLFVSRALKATWLLETTYEDIFNPQYLEVSLYPHMVTTAITKVQHWIHLNLEDESRCHKFYEHYYRKKVFDLAIKFLTKCSKQVIQNEFPNIMHKINPHNLKILSEKCSEVVRVFYDSLENDEKLKSQYLTKEKEYSIAIRHLLKTDTAMILDINEKYFNMNTMQRLSAQQTKFVMKHHNQRFWKKPELYTTWLLNTQAVADSLSSEEAKNLVSQLARAKYLARISWFGYKFLEPIVKRVRPEERGHFKKKVFVNKDVGDQIEEWPYEIPHPPVVETSLYSSIFDNDLEPDYSYFGRSNNIKLMTLKCEGTGQLFGLQSTAFTNNFGCPVIKTKTMLDRLFDEFRFNSFRQTLYELKAKIAAESSPQNREFMILVLVSKSGGRQENIDLLLKLLNRHINEQPHTRAAIIRSLVKRAYIWRLPDEPWNQILNFGHGLGLDGNTPVANCNEGLHAVIIRSLLFLGKCEPSLQRAFLNNFSNLAEYSLNKTEKKIVGERLAKTLISIVEEKHFDTYEAVAYLSKIICALNAYEIKIETFPGLLEIISKYAEINLSEISFVLNSLFKAKVARKQLFRYYFKIVESNASYLNALKHDVSVLDGNKFTDFHTNRRVLKFDSFLYKIFIYFGEKDGIACMFLESLKAIADKKITEKLNSLPTSKAYISHPFGPPFSQTFTQRLIQGKTDIKPQGRPLGYRFGDQLVRETAAYHSQSQSLDFQFGGKPILKINSESNSSIQQSSYVLDDQPFQNMDSNIIDRPNNIHVGSKTSGEEKANSKILLRPFGFKLDDNKDDIKTTDEIMASNKPPENLLALPYSAQPFTGVKLDNNLEDLSSDHQIDGQQIVQIKKDSSSLIPEASQFDNVPQTEPKETSHIRPHVQPLGYQLCEQSTLEEKVYNFCSSDQPLSHSFGMQPTLTGKEGATSVILPLGIDNQHLNKTNANSNLPNQSLGYQFGVQPFVRTEACNDPITCQPLPYPLVNQPFMQPSTYKRQNWIGHKYKNFIDPEKDIKLLGRPLAYLLGDQLISYINKLDSMKNKTSKFLADTIRGNAHLTKPVINVFNIDWETAGTKLIANTVLKCRYVDIDINIEKLLKGKKTANLAYTLSKRTNYKTKVFVKLATKRPSIALKTGLKLMRVHGKEVEPLIWETIKPIVQTLDNSKYYLVKNLANTHNISLNIKASYITTVYNLFKDKFQYEALELLQEVESLLPDMNEEFIENLLTRFLKDDFGVEKHSNDWNQVKVNHLFIRVLTKYIFLSTNEEIQKHRIQTFVEPFLVKMEIINNCPDKKHMFSKYLREMIITFKYSNAFLNSKYVSSLPVMEKVVAWLRKIFSIEKSFKLFVFVHLAMHFCKAVQCSIHLAPEIFSNEKSKHTDGVIMVGKAFGTYVASEVNNLISEYFDSIVEIYYKSFLFYLDKTYKSYRHGSSVWLSSVIKGILEGSEGSEYRLALYLFEDRRNSLRNEDVQEIQNYINSTKGDISQWFTCAGIY